MNYICILYDVGYIGEKWHVAPKEVVRIFRPVLSSHGYNRKKKNLLGSTSEVHRLMFWKVHTNGKGRPKIRGLS